MGNTMESMPITAESPNNTARQLTPQISETYIRLEEQNNPDLEPEDEGMRIKRLTLLGIVENAEDMSKKWHKIQSRPSTKDQVLGSKNKEDRAKLRAEIQKLLQQSNQVADDCEKIRSAYETSQLRQTLSGTAIQS